MKTFIEIDGQLQNLDMLVEVKEYGPQGTSGYKLTFCNGTFVAFRFFPSEKLAKEKAARDRYYKLEATATAIRMYLYDRTIQVTPGPYTRRDEGDY